MFIDRSESNKSTNQTVEKEETKVIGDQRKNKGERPGQSRAEGAGKQRCAESELQSA